jgi:hypothetical protein
MAIFRLNLDVCGELANNVTRLAVLANVEVDGTRETRQEACARSDGATHFSSSLPDDLGEVRVLGVGRVVLGCANWLGRPNRYMRRVILTNFISPHLYSSSSSQTTTSGQVFSKSTDLSLRVLPTVSLALVVIHA